MPLIGLGSFGSLSGHDLFYVALFLYIHFFLMSILRDGNYCSISFTNN
jgi:hypothetical protein